MPDTRPTFPATIAASLAASARATGAAEIARLSASSGAVQELIERSFASNSALMRGDIDQYRALVSYTEDFTLMSPFGGEPTHGRVLDRERWAAIGRFFRNGTIRSLPTCSLISRVSPSSTIPGGEKTGPFARKRFRCLSRFIVRWRLISCMSTPSC